MDSRRFDRLVRSLGRPASRRGALGLVIGGLALLAEAAPGVAKHKKRCKGGKLKCARVCIDPQADFNNCGACGNVCGPGQRCQAGACTGGPPITCTEQPDLTDCGSGRQCSGGVCATPPNCGVAPERCASALDCCGNVCDPAGHTCPLSDPGNPCRTARSCSGGATCVGFVCQ